jgi:hypothetical protein
VGVLSPGLRVPQLPERASLWRSAEEDRGPLSSLWPGHRESDSGPESESFPMALAGWLPSKAKATRGIPMRANLRGCQDGDIAVNESPPSPVVGPTSASPTTLKPPPPTHDPRVRIPDLVGRTLSGARRALRVRDLRPNVTRFRTTEYVPGRVVDTSPDAGARRRRGAVVTLYVAKAPPSDYSPPIPPGLDVDCAAGSGDGPRYEGQGNVPSGPFRVIGTDIYDLDREGDGIGCE